VVLSTEEYHMGPMFFGITEEVMGKRYGIVADLTREST